MLRPVLALSLALAALPAAAADTIEHIAGPNPSFPIAQAVRVPAGAATWYFSGMTPPMAAPGSAGGLGDTEAQATAAFERLKAALAAQGLSLGDVVMLHVYLVGDPKKDGKLDFAGFQAAYAKYFGTADQPSKPARSTVQVAALVAPGILTEIEATAAKLP